MSTFLNPNIERMTAYVPGEQPRDKAYIKLNTNENPYPPAPSVIAAMNDAEIEDLRLYSDPTAKVLKEKLAALYGLKPENIYVGNGSDEVLNFEVSGERIEAVHMLPGYTHNIINLSDSEDLVTLMWANECFDPAKPDTFFEPVEKA